MERSKQSLSLKDSLERRLACNGVLKSDWFEGKRLVLINIRQRIRLGVSRKEGVAIRITVNFCEAFQEGRMHRSREAKVGGFMLLRHANLIIFQWLGHFIMIILIYLYCLIILLNNEY